MTMIRFLGHILPNRLINASQKFEMRHVPLDLKALVTIQIKDSEIEVLCELDHFEQAQFDILHFNVFQETRACVDLLAFASGMGFTVILDTFVGEDDKSKVIQAEDQTLKGLSPFPTPETFHLVLSDQRISNILHMLTATLQEPNVLPINCARAIEAIAHEIVPGEKDKKRRWSHMGKALQATNDYMEPISRLSVGPRHGVLDQPPGADQLEVRRRAWTLMYRFIEYRKGGNTYLSPSEFPLLQ